MQLDKLFDGLLASVRSVLPQIYIKFIVQACLVNNEGSDWKPFVHDLSTFSRCGVRLGKLPGGRIGCYLQALSIALLCLLLISLDGHNLLG